MGVEVEWSRIAKLAVDSGQCLRIRLRSELRHFSSLDTRKPAQVRQREMFEYLHQSAFTSLHSTDNVEPFAKCCASYLTSCRWQFWSAGPTASKSWNNYTSPLTRPLPTSSGPFLLLTTTMTLPPSTPNTADEIRVSFSSICIPYCPWNRCLYVKEVVALIGVSWKTCSLVASCTLVCCSYTSICLMGKAIDYIDIWCPSLCSASPPASLP